MLTTTTTTTVNQKLPIQDILDRLDVTVNIEKADKELANETKYEEGEVLYPTDWAVIETWLLGEKSFSRLEAMVFSVERERERGKIIAVPRVRLYWSLSSWRRLFAIPVAWLQDQIRICSSLLQCCNASNVSPDPPVWLRQKTYEYAIDSIDLTVSRKMINFLLPKW